MRRVKVEREFDLSEIPRPRWMGWRDGDQYAFGMGVSTRWGDPVAYAVVIANLPRRLSDALWWAFPWDYCYLPGLTHRKPWFSSDAPIEAESTTGAPAPASSSSGVSS